MSYCQLILFKGEFLDSRVQFSNAWGGAARIWTSLFDKHVKDPKRPHHSWLSDESNRLWDLAKRKDLPKAERTVLCFTFDRFYVARENFKRMADDLRDFNAWNPSPSGNVNHLPKWAEIIEGAVAFDAIGMYASSVGENLWTEYDEEKDEEIPVPLSRGFEVYKSIEDHDAK